MEYDEDDPAVPGAGRVRHERGALDRLRRSRIHVDETLVGRSRLRTPPFAGRGPRPRSTSTRTCRSCTTTAGARWSPCRCCGADRIVGALVVRRRQPGVFADETCDLLEAFASQSALALTNARLYQELEPQSARADDRQPAQVGVPGEHVARAAHPAERGHRVLRGAAGADVRRAQRTAGGLPARHPAIRPAPAGAAQRRPRPVQGRGRPDGARADHVRRRRRLRLRARRWCASARRSTGSTCALDLVRDARRGHAPTSCGSSRCCST